MGSCLRNEMPRFATTNFSDSTIDVIG